MTELAAHSSYQRDSTMYRREGMPRLKFDNVLHIYRDLKAYLRLDAGIGRNIPARAGERGGSSHGESDKMRQLLANEAFTALGPWVTAFEVAGERSGGNFNPANDVRIKRFYEAFPQASKGRILELGSLEGGHSVVLAKRAAGLVALEGREENLRRARFIKRLYGLSNVEFGQADLETNELSELGEFDAVFCSGLLYHLPEPRALLERVARVSPNLYIATRVTSDEGEDLQVRDGVEGRPYAEGGIAKPLAGLSAEAFWPTLGGLEKLLLECGFTKTRRLTVRSQGLAGAERGPMAEIAAWRDYL